MVASNSSKVPVCSVGAIPICPAPVLPVSSAFGHWCGECELRTRNECHPEQSWALFFCAQRSRRIRGSKSTNMSRTSETGHQVPECEVGSENITVFLREVWRALCADRSRKPACRGGYLRLRRRPDRMAPNHPRNFGLRTRAHSMLKKQPRN